MKRFLSAAVAASTLLAVSPAFAARPLVERISPRQINAQAHANSKPMVEKCADLMGMARGLCLNDLRQNPAPSHVAVKGSAATDKETSKAMAPTIGSMTKPVVRPIRGALTNDGLSRTGVKIERMSRRFVKRTVQSKKEGLVGKCKGLTALALTACLNPRLKLMLKPTEVMEKKDDKTTLAPLPLYMLGESGSLMMSADAGVTWTKSTDGTWKNKSGRPLKVVNGKLVWMTVNSTEWTEVPDWTWMGGDNKWYKFDASWTLTVSGDGGATWLPVAAKMWPGM